MFSQKEQDILCHLIKRFYFHCDSYAINKFSDQPSVKTYAYLLYASTPWFIYAIPIVCWIFFFSYIFIHRKRLRERKWFHFLIQRNLFVLREMYCVSKQCLLHPRNLRLNLKLIWKTWWMISKDDLEMCSHFFNARIVFQRTCATPGCDIQSSNSICIQCRMDDGEQARLKRIYTLLAIRKKSESVWHTMPLDVFKKFIKEYFI